MKTNLRFRPDAALAPGCSGIKKLVCLTLAGAAVLAAASSALAQFRFSFESDLEGWVPSGFNDPSTSVSLGTATIGATHGSRSLSITQTNSGFSWNAKRDNVNQDPFYYAMLAASGAPADWQLEMDVTYRDQAIPDGPVTFLTVSVWLNSDLGFFGVHNQAPTSGHEDKTVHVTIPLTNYAASPLAGNSSFYEVGIGLNGDWGPAEATVYFDNIQLARRPVLSPDIVLNQFNTADEASQWARWWGCAAQTYAWDAAVDADTNANSGSLKITVDFNLMGCTNDNQFASLRTFPTLDGSLFTNLVMDILWAPDSPRRAAGDFGYLEPGFRNTDYSQNWLPASTVPTNAGWIHLVLPINPTAPKIETINGVVLKMWSGDPEAGFTGTATFWVDNVKLIARTNVSVPPPTMAIEKPIPGLRIFASSSGGENQRQSIRTVNPAYSWVGAADPVTYSITISDYPGAAYAGFQTHLFIVPGAGIPNFETSPDYNEPHVVFLDIQNNAQGSAYASFRFKTNQPGGNAMIYGSGTIAGIASPQMRGIWNLTFNPGGQINLATPSGANTNFSMPPAAVSLFGGSAYAYFGIQPNSVASIGQSATFARLQITGVTTPISDSFLLPTLDPSTWEVVAEDAAGVVPVPPDALFWLTWTLPDTGYALQYVTSIPDALADFWAPLTPITSQILDRKRAVVLASQLPLADAFFFRLRKPQ